MGTIIIRAIEHAHPDIVGMSENSQAFINMLAGQVG
jgi:hypothetical protein